MHRLHLVASLLIVSMAVNEVAAGDKEDVEAVIDAIYATANEYDIDAHVRFVIPGETTVFDPHNYTLARPTTWGEGLRKFIDTGGTWDFKHHTVEIDVYGDCAVVIGYDMQTWYPLDDPANTTTGRVTRILNKVDGSWKVVHIHRSQGGFVLPEITDSDMQTK